MTEVSLNLDPKAFRKTNQHEGWREIFTPESGAMQYLSYARLVFGPRVRSHSLQTGGQEWVLFCIKASISVSINGQNYEIGRRDFLYLPRNCTAEITGDAGADAAFAACPSDSDSEPQLVRFGDISEDENYYFDVGSDGMSTSRRIYNMVGHNVKASRLLAGFTIGKPTAWTSWPPHEHCTSKEEFYLFFDMPAPAFSVQFVYTSTEAMEFKEVVQDGDCVTIPGGYHPTAAAPGYSSVFLWVMAAFDPKRDRDFKHGINIQPEFQGVKFV